jgi:hypothetical protein
MHSRVLHSGCIYLRLSIPDFLSCSVIFCSHFQKSDFHIRMLICPINWFVSQHLFSKYIPRISLFYVVYAAGHII